MSNCCDPMNCRALGRTRRYGHYLAESGVGAARALPRGLSALSLRAAREGGARPGPGLPRALRRGHRHQLFARLLLQVGPWLRTGGTRAGQRQRPQSIQQHIWLHLLHTAVVVRLPAGPQGVCSTEVEFLGVSSWFCVPGLDPVLRAL